jgi:hypothetical protein
MPKVLQNAPLQLLAPVARLVHSAVAQLIRVAIFARAQMDIDDERS